MRILLLTLALWLIAAPAYAVCSGPSGTEGEIMYNADYKTMQFCDGTNWWSMKGGGGGGLSCPDGDIQYASGGTWACSSDYVSTKLLVSADGSDGSTSFLDSSQYAHGITVNGNAQVDTTQSKFGGASAQFDGTGDYLTIADSPDWDFGTDDFTVDFWIRPAADQVRRGLISCRQGVNDTSWAVIIYNSTNVVEIHSSASIILSAGTALPNNAWTHVAVVRSGTTVSIYYDGILKASTSNSFNFNNGSTLFIGADIDGSIGNFNGHLDELRISQGIARWTSNFTPPTAPY